MMKRHRPRGFTVVELMVTVTVAGILLAVAVPSFNATSARARLEGVTNELSVDLQYARSEAIRRRTSAALSIDAAGTSYTLTYLDAGTASNVNFKTVALPGNVSLTANATVQFTSLRGLAAARTIDATSTQTSATLRVQTNAAGRVQLCSPGASFPGYPTC
jgi:type IV fimbrial biogenesis protein FimT